MIEISLVHINILAVLFTCLTTQTNFTHLQTPNIDFLETKTHFTFQISICVQETNCKFYVCINLSCNAFLASKLLSVYYFTEQFY